MKNSYKTFIRLPQHGDCSLNVVGRSECTGFQKVTSTNLFLLGIRICVFYLLVELCDQSSAHYLIPCKGSMSCGGNPLVLSMVVSPWVARQAVAF